MQSHRDSDFSHPSLSDVLRVELPKVDYDRLRRDAKAMMAAAASTITGGTPGEQALAEWDAHGVHVAHRPNDPSGCLRISVGGGEIEGEPIVYCVFRGDRMACAAMLRRVILAMESPKGI